jgi:8-hydroxy-5-deazaflavin:NADPH oxidoreductase
VARREQIAQARQTVAIIGGTGALGFGLAVRWAVAGVPIVIGSRDAGRAAEAAERVLEKAPGADVTGYQNEEAAGRASTVLLAVPFRNQSENLNNLRNALLPQTTLIDATVPLAAAVGGRATRVLGVWQGSAAQQAAEMAPRGVTVVSGFHTVRTS